LPDLTCCEGELTRIPAAELLKLGARQVKRLVRSFLARGDRDLVSGKRGKASNNRLDPCKPQRIEAALR
jgi:hypothetical protein